MLSMKKARAEAFEAVYSLLEKAFPPTERRNREDQLALLEKTSYSYRILRSDDGTFLGFLAVWEFDTFRFLEHFAVNEAARGHGIGAKALQLWLEESDKPAILEVEPPETEIARRRIGFYQRCGLTLNDFPYTQPSMQKGQPPIPLMIISWPQSLQAETFSPWQTILHREVYGVSSK